MRGSVIPKGDGKWLLRFHIGSHKYHSEVFQGSYREAQVKLTELLGSSDRGDLKVKSTTTVSEFLAQWLETKTDIAAKARSDYEYHIRLNINPYIGTVRLQDLTPLRIQALYNVSLLSERGLSGRTIEYAHTVLNQALTQAVLWDILAKNPAEHVNLPKTTTTEFKVLTVDEMNHFLSTNRDHPQGGKYHLLWLLLFTTGLRPEEALALRWEDFDGKGLQVRRALHNDGSGSYEATDDTKTEGSQRYVGLASSVCEAITAARRAFLRDSARVPIAGWMFATRNGTTLDISNVRKEFKSACQRAGIEGLRLYDTRHTHATHLLAKKLNAKVVASRLGHVGDPSVLLRKYAHVIPEMTQEAISITEGLLSAL